jgi:putative chitinase
MNFDELVMATSASAADAIRYVEPLNAAMAQYKIDSSAQRKAAFLATVSVESARLRQVEEGLYYKDPARLVAIYPRVFKSIAQATPYARNPSGLSQILYDGYHGRGLIQLTWLKNYQAASDALGQDFVADPASVCEPANAALTAAWFFASNGCNAAADKGDMRAVTRIVNGPALLHLAERIAQYKIALEVFSNG